MIRVTIPEVKIEAHLPAMDPREVDAINEAFSRRGVEERMDLLSDLLDFHFLDLKTHPQ